MDRRELLKNGTACGLAWLTPTVVSLAVSPASAQVVSPSGHVDTKDADGVGDAGTETSSRSVERNVQSNEDERSNEGNEEAGEITRLRVTKPPKGKVIPEKRLPETK